VSVTELTLVPVRVLVEMDTVTGTTLDRNLKSSNTHSTESINLENT